MIVAKGKLWCPSCLQATCVVCGRCGSVSFVCSEGNMMGGKKNMLTCYRSSLPVLEDRIGLKYGVNQVLRVKGKSVWGVVETHE